MKNNYTKIKILILSILLPWQSILATNTAHLSRVEEGIKQRWEKVKEAKENFARYEKKSDEEILCEYQELNKLRNQLWYNNLAKTEFIANPDYIKVEIINSAESYKHAPFYYNCITNTYNASTILLGYHFIAMEEPAANNLLAFFHLLINQDVSILVRLNPEAEYFNRHNFHYWDEYSVNELNYPAIQPTKVLDGLEVKAGSPIPYFYTNKWKDHDPIDAVELYRLVQEVRGAYEQCENRGPIACHCKAGVGRTGTFIAAFLLANMLDNFEPSEISIEALVLKLSIQRSPMVAQDTQYLSLYKFCDYYLAKKRVVEKDEG